MDLKDFQDMGQIVWHWLHDDENTVPFWRDNQYGQCCDLSQHSRVAMKVRYPSRVPCAYHFKPLKVRTWHGFHRRGCKQICMDVRQLIRRCDALGTGGI